jgi:predicted unusual protein kinase regulating ubiquinone biosynthesis (AarF/ABC1/UbiB family)
VSVRVGENGGVSEREREIPGSSIARAARLAGLPLGHAGRAAIGVGKRVGGRPAELVAAELQQRTAEQLFSVLGQLKGGAMKFGQALSVMEAAMPEEMVGPYRATLTKLQESGPPMGAARVHAILAEELGPRWASTKLVEFDDVPAAAASIGQVHRAVWRDGREVAVKIQYPGAGKALLSDLNQISRVARMAGSWMPGVDIKPIMDELRARMAEELDYHLEATNQRHFARAFRGDEDVLVPDVLVDSPQVLVTEWVGGTPLARIIRDGTEEERDEAASLYLEFLLRAPGRARMLHADPHPGNFRVTDDGRLGVFDFGAVNRLPDGLPSAMGRLLTAALAGDADEMARGLRAEGFIRPGVDIDPEALLDYLSPLIAPILHEEFTFTREWLRSAANHVNDPRRPQFLIGLKLNLPPEYLLIHRVWLGGIGVLSQVGGTVPLREMICAYLPGMDESRLPPDPAQG